MRWLAGPQLEIYVQAAECQPGFMENTSEWSSLMHCPWSTQFSGSAPLPTTAQRTKFPPKFQWMYIDLEDNFLETF